MLFDPIPTPEDDQRPEVRGCGKAFAFDWEHNQYIMSGGSPLIVEGMDAIKEWIQLICRTRRDRYAIYPPDFGAELQGYIGRKMPKGYNVSELRRELLDSAQYMPYILDIGEMRWDGSRIYCTVTIKKGDAVEESEVRIDGII